MLLAATEFAWQGTLSRDLWLLCGFALFVAVVLGFTAGYCSARLRDQLEQRQARNGLLRLFETAGRSIDMTREICNLLEQASSPVFHPVEAESLATRSRGLFDSIARIVTRHRPPSSSDTEIATTSKPSARHYQPSGLEWQLAESHPVTALPNAATFKDNLELMCDHMRLTGNDGGFLAVQIDKLTSLRSRFGNSGADSLLKKLASLVCRSVRDEDLVCQSASDRIVVLMPNIDSDTRAKIARTVREAVRQYHFRVEDHGTEVLVTASFGYVACRPGDHPDFVLDRAADALTKSQRLGRNQLHVHDGATALYCAATS